MWAINLRIIGVVLGTLALYTLIANKIPQVQSEVPHALTLGANVTPEQLTNAGDQLYHGAGGCTACHGLGTRAPNLLTDEKGQGPIGARCGKREAGKDCKAYIYESLTSPKAYVVQGYEPIMPEMGRILSPQQIWALVAFLESNGGSVDVTASDIPASTTSATSTSSTPSAGIAGGSTEPMAMIRGAGCTGCHKINGEGGAIGRRDGVGHPSLDDLGNFDILDTLRRHSRRFHRAHGHDPRRRLHRLSQDQRRRRRHRA